MTAQAAARLKAFVGLVLPIIVTLGGFAGFILVRTEARAEAGERKVDELRAEHRESDAGVRDDIKAARQEVQDLRNEMARRDEATRADIGQLRSEILLELRRRR